MYFSWPASLDIRYSSFNSEVAGSLQGPEGPQHWHKVFDIQHESVSSVHRNVAKGWECRGVTSKENPFFELLVSPDKFAPTHLCDCLSNFQGDGTNCTVCPPGVTSIWNPDGKSRCCACPEGRTMVNDSSVCYKCMGPGCAEQVCHGQCSQGYVGSLCSYCANEHARKMGSDSCIRCTRDRWFGSWTYLKYVSICTVWTCGIGGVLWHFVYHKVERYSALELGLSRSGWNGQQAQVVGCLPSSTKNAISFFVGSS